MGRRRYNRPSAKDGELLAKYGKGDEGNSVYYCYPKNNSNMKSDCRLISKAFEEVVVCDGKTMMQLLEERCYDITTLKFSVMKRK